MEIRFTDGSISVYTDPRRFGIVKLFHRAEETIEPLLEVLGPEPFDDWNADLAAKKCRGKRSPIKTTLLDQRFVVGVGNIYACEALHNAGIAPTKLAGKLVTKAGKPTKSLVRLVDEVKIVLNKAIAAGGSTLNDFADVDGNFGYFSHHFTIYGREDQPCLKGVRWNSRENSSIKPVNILVPTMPKVIIILLNNRAGKYPQCYSGYSINNLTFMRNQSTAPVPVSANATIRYHIMSILIPSIPIANLVPKPIPGSNT